MFICESCGEVDVAQVVNLQNYYGKLYKIGREAGEFKGSSCPWHMTIECKHGHIAPNGKDLLWVSADKPIASSNLRNLAASDDRVTMKQDGDDGVSVVVHVDNINLISAIMKPKPR
jgi:hypothetical protein